MSNNNTRENFTAEEEKMLIYLVSQNPLIYNSSSSDYKNPYKRDKTWEEIANHLNKNSKACKSRWRNIKDTYYRQRKKVIHGTAGSVANPRSKFEQYCVLLSFLENVSQEKASVYTVDDENVSQEKASALDDENSESTIDQKILLSSWPTDQMSNSEIIPSHQTLQSPSSADEYFSHDPSLNSMKGVKKKKKQSRKMQDGILLKYLQKRDRSRQKMIQNLLSIKTRDSDDEIDLFTRQANTILRKLPPYMQIKAMKDLFETLTKYKTLAIETPSPVSLCSTSEPQMVLPF